MEFSFPGGGPPDPQIYPEKPPRIELVQIHISAIFFAGEHVCKVKKPVNFGFLDFTTLGKGKYFCQQEFYLHRRLPRGL